MQKEGAFNFWECRGWLARLRYLARDESGQSIAELAIAVPVLTLITLAAADVGKYAYQSIELGNAARAGVQYGAQNQGTAADTSAAGGIVAAAKADAPDIASPSVTASNYCTCDSAPGTHYAGCAGVPACTATSSDHVDLYVQVTASGTYTPIVPYPGVPSSITVARTAIQQVNP